MIDCTHDNVTAVNELFPAPAMIAGYDTGTPDVKWSFKDWATWPTSVMKVTIDQGYQSPPITLADIRDVEPTAWQAKDAVVKSNWRAIRPTIYCDRYDLTAVLDYGWKGDLWLAIPGHTGPPPKVPGCNVVAVQNAVNVDNLYDSSVVYDNYWPLTPPMEDKVISGIIINDASTPFPAGAFKQVQLYIDFIPAIVRVAVHSVAHGYSQIEEVNLVHHTPVTVHFIESDVDGVSLVSKQNVGFTLA